ncbi:MAG: hypothetical protein RBS56_02860 [Candidatus Gracilibacteria bacterium]|jgi:cytoskeletal protein CcmA (bactofilin family)|nr:hypothetical protein [Candidatus Gracilibacteria bacterium]
MIRVFSLLISLILFFGVFQPFLVFANTLSNLLYEGRLLNSTGAPLSSSHSFRFSFWDSSDFLVSDIDGLGQIDVLAPNYSSWQEVQLVTPNSNGTYSVKLGLVSPLPVLDPSVHKFLQVEVKAVGDPDTAYELLDPTGDNGLDLIDRKELSSVPYSKLGDYSIGSLEDIFILDFNNTVENTATGSIKLMFGQNLGKYLSYDYDNSTFVFNDNLLIDGDLDVLGETNIGGDLNTSGNLGVTGDGEFSGDLAVDGDTYLSGNANIDGVIIGGSNQVQITDSLGNLDGTKLIDDSVKDTAIDFGLGADQTNAMDVPVEDNFDFSNGGEVQTVLEDLDAEITNLNIISNNISGTTYNTFTLDNDDTGGDVALQFGDTLAKRLYWDEVDGLFVFNDNLRVEGEMELLGHLHTGSLQIQITDSFGYVDGTAIQSGSVGDNQLNLGFGVNQISAQDILIQNLNGYTQATNLESFVDEIGLVLYERFSTGVVSGGLITASTGNTINIASGVGYINYNTVKNKRITWPNFNSYALPYNGDNYVYIDSSGAISITQVPPIVGSKIFLGYAYTVNNNSMVGTIAPIKSYIGDFEHRVQSYIDMAIGPISPSGNIVSNVPASLALQISSGKIYNNLNMFTTTDTSTFTKWYNTADFGWLPDVNGLNLVNTRHYNDVSGDSVNVLTGTVTFVNGSTNVSGVATSFLTEVAAGDYLYLQADGRNYKTLVQSVDSDTQITLGFVYTGSSSFGVGIVDKALKKMSSGFWKKDLLARDMNGVVHYMYSQAEYATEDEAKEASLPILPQAISNAGVIYLASVVVQEGATNLDDSLYDLRPNFQRLFGYGTSGTVGTVPDHGSLLGLTDDDHPQYLNIDGSKKMQGDLDLDSNNILGAVIDGDLNTLQDISINSLQDRNKSIKLRPTYPNMVINKDGSFNKVTLKEGNDVLNNLTYLVLSSNEAVLNDLDLIISLKLPEDFVSFQSTPIQLRLKSETIFASENKIELSLTDSLNNPVSLLNAVDLHSSVANEWILKNIGITGAPTFTPGSVVNLNIKLHSRYLNKIFVSDLILNYVGK